MAHSQADVLIRQGHPIRVEWMGWSSDTYKLSRMGWEMATHEDYMRDSMEVVFHHRQSGVMAKGGLRGYRGLHGSMMRDLRYNGGDGIDISFMQFINNTIFKAISEPMTSMQWVDMEPVDSFMDMREWRPSELSLFRKLATPIEQELIVDPEDVQSMLDQILKVQGGMRKEIRARDRKRERDAPEERQIHAQIISLKAA